MRRIVIGLTGMVSLAVALFAAGILLGQPPFGQPRPVDRASWSAGAGAVRGGRGADPPPFGFAPPAFPLLEALDANRDGVLSQDEIENATAALKTLDKNKDGKLTEDEFMPSFPGGMRRGGGPGFGGPGGPMGPGGVGGPMGRGGPGGPMGGDRKILKQFDKNSDGRLDLEERKAARAAVGVGRGPGAPGGRPGLRPRGGPGGGRFEEPVQPGEKVKPSEVETYPDAALYEPTVLRTLFLEFENDDWEDELAAFKGTDVEVPATLTVDGKKYPNVGVHFRGNSSYMMVPAGRKRSLNVSLDFVDSKQRLYGYKTLNLLNCAGDSSMLSTALYSHIARQYIPAPKANFVKVVINGESWGVYCCAQQFNKVFLAENYPSNKGARWKVGGHPGADSGLRYLGENVEEYKRRYEIKTKDKAKSWKDLIALCRILDQTPPDQLEQALKPILDIDGVLWFLALDVAVANSDGYWTRASDYSLYQDPSGKFHVIPYDMNEAFHTGHGPGGPGGPGGPRFGGGPGGPGGPSSAGGLGFGPPSGGPFGFGPPMAGGPGGFGPPMQDGDPRNADRPNAGRDPQAGGDADRPRRDASDRDFGPGGRGRGRGGRRGFGPGGPGGPGGGGGGVTLDPLVALDDPSKPLRSKLLAVPSLRAKYLKNLRTIAESSLNWKKLGPVVAQYRTLLEKEIAADTRKLTTTETFLHVTSDETENGQPLSGTLRDFAERRSKFLLEAVQSGEDRPRRP